VDKTPAILAIETSTETGSVALGLGGSTAETARLETPRTHGRDLMGLIDGVFERARVERESLSAIAVDIGPGSYTGLRVGIATAQGIALALGVPCAGFEATRVVAAGVATAGEKLAVLIDVRAGEVYFRLFQNVRGEWTPSDRHGAAQPAELVKLLPGGALLAGSGAQRYAELLEGAGFALCDESSNEPRAEALLELAKDAFKRNELCAPGDLQAVYPRPSSAEIAFRKAGKL